MSANEKKPLDESKPIIVSNKSEEERLLEAMNRSDMEKFQLFMQMLRTNALLKKATINHK